MRKQTITLSLLLTLMLAFPLPAFSFWGSDGEQPASLNLQSGYDVNTVTSASGRIVAIHTGNDRPDVQLELESNGGTIFVCIGPQRYWAEKGIPFRAGDEISVRGSKAQDSDGAIYLLAQKITSTHGITIVLRDESGRPAWAGNGKGMGRKQGPRGNRPLPFPQPLP
jgi:hypothetical protein